VELYFLTVVRDCISEILNGITILRYEIAFFIISGEEGVKVIKNLKFYLINFSY